MSTANSLAVTCLLDDGTGTFPIDVSSQVSLSAGIDVSGYGRADEASSASAAQLTLTLKNNDGSFTTGVPGGFGGGGFGGGFFGGVVTLSKGQRIRLGLTLGATYRNCFTGRIDSIGQSFQGAPGLRSDITITALDAFSDYAKRPMRSMVEQEILLDSPAAYYTLGEATGATSAGDTSGNGASPLALAGTGTALTFGTGTGPTDDLPCVQFNGGTYLSGLGQLAAGSAFTVECFFATTVVPTSTAAFVYLDDRSGSTDGGVYLTIDATGNVGVASGSIVMNSSPAVDVNDGLTHHAAATLTAAGVLTLYVDGVVTNTTTNLNALTPRNMARLRVAPTPGSTGAIVGVSGPPTGSISHVALYNTALSSGRVASHAAGRTGFTETTDARLTRIASYAGATAITTTPSGQLMPTQPTSGQALLDALGVVSTAELGVLFIDGSGQLRMQGRDYRAAKTTATLTLSAKALEPDPTSIVDDTQQAINQMTVTRSGGATQTWPLLTPSVNLYPGSLDLTVDTDATALGYAQWIVSKHSSPGPRIPTATTTNLRTSASAAGVFAREIGDRLHLTGMPATTNPNLGDVTIEGWSMHLDRDTWTYTYNLLPWSLFTAFILDDATFGVLDSTTPIGF